MSEPEFAVVTPTPGVHIWRTITYPRKWCWFVETGSTPHPTGEAESLLDALDQIRTNEAVIEAEL